MKNTTLRDLRTTLVRYPSELARGATRHPSLQPYPNGEAVLAALALDSALSPTEREALVRALVIEMQASRHAVWSTLLILAFQPALNGMCKRAHVERSEDIEATLMQFLLESVAAVRVSTGPLVLTLYRATARRYFRQVRAGRRPGKEVPVDERVPEIPWHREPDAFVKCAAREVLRACEDIPGATSAVLEQVGETPVDETRGGATRRERDRRRKKRQRVLAQVRWRLGVTPERAANENSEAHSTPSSRELGRWRR
jgi:hypothetical protein